MGMELKRKLAEGTVCTQYEVIKLTEEEMRQVYEEYRTKVHFKHWMADLLEEYDFKEQDEETLIDRSEQYIDLM